ncbi:MAG: hypothetical protein M1568_04520 [Acidobacteria bacterium]|jgi:hypothetical protein|nr:hypothetical protein [Acidobacteriota bacterium]
MANIFKKIGIGIADVGKWVATAVKDVVGLAVKVEKILTAAKPLEKPFIDGLVTVVSDVEKLLNDAQGAVTAAGMNFEADSETYHDFLKLIDDFKTLAPIVEEALAILEGKSVASAASASASAAVASTTK